MQAKFLVSPAGFTLKSVSLESLAEATDVAAHTLKSVSLESLAEATALAAYTLKSFPL
jgi:hypothetical protein